MDTAYGLYNKPAMLAVSPRMLPHSPAFLWYNGHTYGGDIDEENTDF